jgi:4'-phosphopantetheinyl transferase
MIERKMYWFRQQASEIPDDLAWLGNDEQAVQDTLRIAKRRKDWLLGRWTAKTAVRRLFESLGKPPPPHSDMQVLAASDGAPEIFLAGKPAGILLSISHSHPYGFCILFPAGSCAGCDLEKIMPRTRPFVRDYFTEAEQAFVNSFPDADHPLLVNLIWCAKESALKALREGLRLDTRRVEVSLEFPAPNNGWNPLSVYFSQNNQSFSGFWMQYDGFVWVILADSECNLSPIPL